MSKVLNSEVDASLRAFHSNLTDVERLINFDRDVLSLAIDHLSELEKKLRKQRLENPQLNVTATLRVLSNVRSNDSLRPRYQTIFNQAVVLLVSYFASILGDFFRIGIAHRLSSDQSDALLREEIKVTFGELKERGWNVKDVAADVLISKRDFNFQDMASTHRAAQSVRWLQRIPVTSSRR
jgi:hypothetical protein